MERCYCSTFTSTLETRHHTLARYERRAEHIIHFSQHNFLLGPPSHFMLKICNLTICRWIYCWIHCYSTTINEIRRFCTFKLCFVGAKPSTSFTEHTRVAAHLALWASTPVGSRSRRCRPGSPRNWTHPHWMAPRWARSSCSNQTCSLSVRQTELQRKRMIKSEMTINMTWPFVIVLYIY